MYRVIDFTPTPDTGIMASADVIADTEAMPPALLRIGSGSLRSLVVVDKDDQKAAIDIYFLSSSGSMGAENSGASISDANGATILGMVAVAVADYKDLGGVSVAMFRGLDLPLISASGSNLVYCAIVNGAGTPTYTASGLVLRLGVLQD